MGLSYCDVQKVDPLGVSDILLRGSVHDLGSNKKNGSDGYYLSS
jgi:hypothetical protein